MFAERLVKYMLAYDGIAEQIMIIHMSTGLVFLKQNDLLPKDIDNTLYIIRRMRNDAVHSGDDDLKRAKR